VSDGGWTADLSLRYERRAGRTVLAGRSHRGPLFVQKPLYPEGPAVCHGIVLHPPAGVVGGDRLALRVASGPGAHALLTTPGAGKWYRSAGPTARQTVALEVAAGGALEYLPQPAIAFDGARADIDTRIDVARDAGYIGWDLLCLGRTASGERFRSGVLASRVHVAVAGEPAWIERARIEGGSRLLEAPAGLAGAPVTGTLLAVSAKVAPPLVAACRAIEPAQGRGGVTRLPGLLVARYLGASAEAGHAWFARLWSVLRPALLGLAAQPPRIWRT